MGCCYGRDSMRLRLLQSEQGTVRFDSVTPPPTKNVKACSETSHSERHHDTGFPTDCQGEFITEQNSDERLPPSDNFSKSPSQQSTTEVSTGSTKSSIRCEPSSQDTSKSDEVTRRCSKKGYALLRGNNENRRSPSVCSSTVSSSRGQHDESVPAARRQSGVPRHERTVSSSSSSRYHSNEPKPETGQHEGVHRRERTVSSHSDELIPETRQQGGVHRRERTTSSSRYHSDEPKPETRQHEGVHRRERMTSSSRYHSDEPRPETRQQGRVHRRERTVSSDEPIPENRRQYGYGRRYRGKSIRRSSPISTHSLRSAAIDFSDEESDFSPLSQGVPTWKLKSICDHPSYHGQMAGKQAKHKLISKYNQYGNTCYLTRYSEKNDCCVLTVLQNVIDDSFIERDEFLIRNFPLIIDKEVNKSNKYKRVITEIEGTEEQFDNIFDLLSFYERNPVNHEIFGIGFMIESSRYRHLKKHSPAIRRTGSVSSEICSIEADVHSLLDEKFKLEDLGHFSWVNDKDEIKIFKLTERISGTWQDAATLLGMDTEVIEDYQQKTSDNVQRFKYVVSDWIQDFADDEAYPATWRGLLRLLFDLERKTAADFLTRALQGRTEHGIVCS